MIGLGARNRRLAIVKCPECGSTDVEPLYGFEELLLLCKNEKCGHKWSDET